MKRFLLIFASCICIISTCLTSISASDGILSWYCKRNKDHKQPAIDANMSFIKDYGGYYVDTKHNDDCEEKVIYLTFDAGYENGNIEKILNVLAEEGVSASFFVLKNLLDKNPELIKRMEQEGHLICNHTSTHVNITEIGGISAIREELNALEERYREITGKDMPKYFRPPEGKFDRLSIKDIYSLGYKTVFWSFAYADWDNNAQMSEAAAKKKIFDNIHNGEIMLLHPTSATNAKIMKDVITELKAQGFRFATLDEL